MDQSDQGNDPGRAEDRPPPPPPPPPSPAAAQAAPAVAPVMGLSLPEQILALGALLVVVVVQLVGDVILDQYAIGLTTWLASVAILVVLFAAGAGIDLPWGRRTTLTLLGYFAAVMGVWEFLADVDTGGAAAATWVFRIVMWAAAVILAYGAYQMSQTAES